MSMADVYADDFGPEESNNERTDRFIDAGPGFGYGLPTTARRGGIKYPTKEFIMTMKENNLEAELKAINDLREELNTRAAKLRRKIRANKIPLAPPSATFGDSFGVDVKFTSSGPRYRFLLQRVPGKGWYTTGQKPENAFFPTWEALVTWLRSPDVYSHSAIMTMNAGGTRVLDASSND